MNNKLPPTVITVRGPYDSAKSTLGLTIPGYKVIIDLEYGSHRAAWRFPKETYSIWTLPDELRTEPSIDGIEDSALDDIVFIPGQMLRGWREAFAAIARKYIDSLRNPDVDIVIFDTAKELWTMITKSHLQRMHEEQFQEAKKAAPPGVSDAEIEQGVNFRKRLIQIEYGDPNSQMKKIIDLARQWRKTLVLINHERDEYVNTYENGREVSKSTGRKELDGWTKTMDLADWVLATNRVNIKDDVDGKLTVHYQTLIVKSPYGKTIAGMEFIDSGFPNIARVSAKIAGANAS